MLGRRIERRESGQVVETLESPFRGIFQNAKQKSDFRFEGAVYSSRCTAALAIFIMQVEDLVLAREEKNARRFYTAPAEVTNR